MEEEKKVWIQMDVRNCFFIYKENLWRIYVSATKLQNMIKEMTLKVSLYNLFRRTA
jgi:hypothetical protein